MKIAFGTDQGLVPHGQNAREFALMVGAGMKPMDAIIAATGSAADLIGDEQDIGSVRPGRFADIVAVDGDPLADVTVLRACAVRDERRRGLQAGRPDRSAADGHGQWHFRRGGFLEQHKTVIAVAKPMTA